MSRDGLSTNEYWDQLIDETDNAYHRFTVYLELGHKRSMEAVREKVGKRSGYIRQLERWSAQYKWVDRARAYDKHLLRKSLRNKEDILDHGKGRLLKMVDQALDQLEEVLMGNDVMFVGEGGSSLIGQKIKVAESVLDRAGLVKLNGVAEEGDSTTDVNNYIQMVYNRIQKIDKRDGIE